ncbi:MAG: NUDIX domain-containing protein [Ruminococcus sp.]|nr:NUDIX domain-containing protein [Ruminococcus sp.]
MENCSDKEWSFAAHINAVGGVVKNSEGKILLVKHNRRGWTLPGGVVENGENLIDALKREVMEETGIEVTVERLFCVSSNTAGHAGYGGVKYIPTKVMLDFVCKGEGEPRGSEENSESGWFTEDEAREMVKTPAEGKRFGVYLEKRERAAYLEYVTNPEFVLRGEWDI